MRATLHYIDRLVTRSPLLPIFLLIIIVGGTAALYLHDLDKYSLLYYGDSVSHLLIARSIIDSIGPGLQHVGTVWLPLPFFLLLPFSLINFLFKTGLSGTFVSLPCLAITSLFLFRMIKTFAPTYYIGLAGALLYAFNPNILYIGITAMTEAPFMLFFVASAYYFQRWTEQFNEHHDSLSDLLKCSIFICLATLCRYEGWILPIFFITLVALFFLKKRHNIYVRKTTTKALLTSTVSVSGIVFWLLFNTYLYGDPLKFANADYYSAASQALNRPYRELLFLQPFNVLSIYAKTALAMYGPLLLGSAVIGYVLYELFCARKNSKIRLTFLYLALPPFLTLILLIAGIGEMGTWFNSRFLVLLSPLVVLLVSILIKLLPKAIRENRLALGSLICLLFAYPLLTPIIGEVITFSDAKNGFLYNPNPFAVQTGDVLGSKYKGNGSIMMLTGSPQGHRIMSSSGISLRHFDEISGASIQNTSFYEPWLSDKWLVISKQHAADAKNTTVYWLNRQNVLDEHFKTAYENQYYKILVAID